jgi:hypothetical protein
MAAQPETTATVRILYWRDIPSKVEVEDEGCIVTRSLSERYQELIHRLAVMQSGEGDVASAEQWRVAAIRSGDAITVAMQVIDELEEEFDHIVARSTANRLNKVGRGGRFVVLQCGMRREVFSKILK